MNYKITSEKYVFNDFFKIKEAKISHDTFDGNNIEIERKCFERGDSVAVLIYETDSNSILFTNQFRYASIKEGNGWLLEIPAGSMEEGDTPEMRVKKEAEEEIGYTLNQLEFIGSFFVSPGGTSERVFVYFSEVNSANKLFEGGGLKSEQEDIQLIKISVDKLTSLIQQNQIRDDKSIIALQWFLLNKK